jgi:DNA modification methylase
MSKLTITYRPTSDLIPYARNSRTHSEEQVGQIAASIKEFGFTNPVLVDQDSGIIAGHGRVMAAQKLGLGEVPTITLAGLTEAQRKAYIIADNRLALNAGWDDEMLRLEIADLKEADFDLDLLGFDDEELAALDVEEVHGETDPDEVPEPPADPVTVLGDVWTLGNHRLMCGDSTSIDAVEKLMAGEKADMVFTDPPYNTGMSAKKHNGSTRLTHMFDDDYTDQEWDDFLTSIANQYWIICKDDCAAYVCLNWKRSKELIPKFTEASFKFSNLIIWDKVVHGLGSDYKYTHEFIHVFKKGNPKLDTHQGDKEYQDVWRIARKVGRDDDHATKKPLELVERGLRHASLKGEICADLFGGSGSTLIACEKTGRKARLMELAPNYNDVIVKRWQDFTGKKALHESGKTFDEMAKARGK